MGLGASGVGPEAAQSASWDKEKLSKAAWVGYSLKRPAKLDWPAGFIFFFYSNSLLFFYYFFLSFNMFFLSLLLSCSTPSFSPFISLLPSIFFFFLNPQKWDNKTWNCEKNKVGPKKGASQQLRQWNKFHFATPENLQDIVYLYYYFFIILISLISLIFLYLSSYGLVFFTCLVKLHCLTDFLCALFHSVLLIYCLSLHLCSISTLL